MPDAKPDPKPDAGSAHAKSGVLQLMTNPHLASADAKTADEGLPEATNKL